MPPPPSDDTCDCRSCGASLAAFGAALDKLCGECAPPAAAASATAAAATPTPTRPSTAPAPRASAGGGFLEAAHVKYVAGLAAKTASGSSFKLALVEHIRMSGAYWGLAAMALLGRDLEAEMCESALVGWVYECYAQHDDAFATAGFGAAVGHDVHLLYTLSALQILAIAGRLRPPVEHVHAAATDAENDARRAPDGSPLYLPSASRDAIAAHVARLQRPDGSFSGDQWGEIDTRFTYCAVYVLELLAAPPAAGAIDRATAAAFLGACLNWDGGFGSVPGAESHAGQIFCCVGALSILGRLDVVNIPDLGWWLMERQCDSGGLNGRPEKQADVCYSWWILSSMQITGTTSYIHRGKLHEFIVACQDDVEGGIADRPGNMGDVFHTFFGVAGISLLGHFDAEADAGFSHYRAVDPTFALPRDVVEALGLAAHVVEGGDEAVAAALEKLAEAADSGDDDEAPWDSPLLGEIRADVEAAADDVCRAAAETAPPAPAAPAQVKHQPAAPPPPPPAPPAKAANSLAASYDKWANFADSDDDSDDAQTASRGAPRVTTLDGPSTVTIGTDRSLTVNKPGGGVPVPVSAAPAEDQDDVDEGYHDEWDPERYSAAAAAHERAAELDETRPTPPRRQAGQAALAALVANGGCSADDSHLWSQTAAEVTVSLVVPKGTRAASVSSVTHDAATLVVRWKGQASPPIEFALAHVAATMQLERDASLGVADDDDDAPPTTAKAPRVVTPEWELIDWLDARADGKRLLRVTIAKRSPGGGAVFWWDRASKDDTAPPLDVGSIAARKLRGGVEAQESWKSAWEEAHAQFRQNRIDEQQGGGGSS